MPIVSAHVYSRLMKKLVPDMLHRLLAIGWMIKLEILFPAAQTQIYLAYLSMPGSLASLVIVLIHERLLEGFVGIQSFAHQWNIVNITKNVLKVTTTILFCY